MGGCFGGSELEGELQKLRADLLDYFGYQNEIDLQLMNPEPVEKPASLISLEQCEAFSVLPEKGGISDQSYIWLLAIGVCRRTREMMHTVQKRNQDLENNFVVGQGQ